MIYLILFVVAFVVGYRVTGYVLTLRRKVESLEFDVDVCELVLARQGVQITHGVNLDRSQGKTLARLGQLIADRLDEMAENATENGFDRVRDFEQIREAISEILTLEDIG